MPVLSLFLFWIAVALTGICLALNSISKSLAVIAKSKAQSRPLAEREKDSSAP